MTAWKLSVVTGHRVSADHPGVHFQGCSPIKCFQLWKQISIAPFSDGKLAFGEQKSLVQSHTAYEVMGPYPRLRTFVLQAHCSHAIPPPPNTVEGGL